MKFTSARRLFRIFAFVALIPENYFTLVHPAGSLIWSRNHKNFIPIEDIPRLQAEKQDYLRKSRELETHNFQKEILKVGYYQEANIVHFYDNDTKITGVSGELWNVLSEYLNFTMITIRSKDSNFGGKLPNGSYDGLLGMLKRNDIQIIPKTGTYVAESLAMTYTTPVWETSYRLYIRPESKSDGTWMFNMFTRSVWCSILMLFVFMSVLGYTMQRYSMRVSNDKHFCHNLSDHFFYTFATFCCQGFIPDSLYRRAKILGFMKKIFAWLLLITLSSNLISYMTNKKVQPPFEDLGTMFNETAYNIVVFNGSIVYDKFKKVAGNLGLLKRYKERIYDVTSPVRLYQKGCWGKRKYAILDSEDRQRAYGRFKCNLAATGASYFPTWIAAGVSKTFKYKRTLDTGILKLSECGITDRLMDRWMAIKLNNVDPNVVNSINFDQVSMLFTILCMGMIASIFILIIEYIIFLRHYNQRKIRGKKKFYPQGKRR